MVYAKFLWKVLQPKIQKLQLDQLQHGVLIAKVHGTNNVTAVLTEYVWELLPHPAYLVGMSPCDYDLFMKLKEPFQRGRF